jgi:hypothetical protein
MKRIAFLIILPFMLMNMLCASAQDTTEINLSKNQVL